MTEVPSPPAGWYPNPEDTGQRYWDGTAWTEHRVGAADSSAPTRAWSAGRVFYALLGPVLVLFGAVGAVDAISSADVSTGANAGASAIEFAFPAVLLVSGGFTAWRAFQKR